MRNDGEVTRADKFAGNIIAGAYTIVCGVFLLLVGLDVFGEQLSIRMIALPAVLMTIGLVFLTTSLYQHNSVSMWLALAFITPAVVTLLVNYTPATYLRLYPVYIAIPAISSLFAMTMSRSKKELLNVVILFGCIAGIFSLQSSGLAGWGVVVPLLVVFVGLAVVVTALVLKKGDNDND